MKKYFFIFSLITFFACTTFKDFKTFESDNVVDKYELEKRILNLSKEFDGKIGLYAKNLKTDEVISVNADSLFPTASVIKLPILIALFKKFKSNEITPESLIVIKDSTKVGGAGILQFFNNDVQIKVIDAATLMIILSDNTATNAIIDLLGNTHDQKLDFVNTTMETLGIKNTKLLNKVFSFATKKNTPEAKRFGLGFSSPNDMGKLLEMIYKHQVIDSFYSEWIIKIMLNQQDESMIRKLLPYYELKGGESIKVANKTGAIERSRIDVGIVYAPKCDFVIAIFADESKDTRWTYDNKAENAVAKAAKMVYNYFNK